MSSGTPGHYLIRSERDLSGVRKLLRSQAQLAGLGTLELTKFVAAGSEIARNILKYADLDGASVTVSLIESKLQSGVRAVFVDLGPGIEDLDLALQDGYSTSGSLGIGLPGARRLCDEFSLESEPLKGTTVTLAKWRR